MNQPTQPPAADSASLSDAALGVGVHGEPLLPCPHCGHTDFDDWPIMEASGDEQQYIRCVWCFAAAPKPKWNTRAPARELDMSTKPENLYTLAEHVHGIDNSDGWLPIDSAPEGCAVLLAIEYESGRRRVLRAMRAGDKTLHLSDEQDPWDGCLYDEDEDCYYCAPGWYEKNEYDECNWAVSDKPIAWQPLPAAPANGGGCE